MVAVGGMTMPYTEPGGNIIATVKGENGKKNIVIMEAIPHKSRGKCRADGMPVGGRCSLQLTDDGAMWIMQEMAKGADIDDLAGEIGVDTATLYNSRNGPKVRRAVKEGRDKCNNRLRKAQVTSALNGNSTMLIWLGKNRLGQTDRPIDESQILVSPLDEFAKEMDRYRRAEKDGSD
jgi:hypothetical protein